MLFYISVLKVLKHLEQNKAQYTTILWTLSTSCTSSRNSSLFACLARRHKVVCWKELEINYSSQLHYQFFITWPPLLRIHTYPRLSEHNSIAELLEIKSPSKVEITKFINIKLTPKRYHPPYSSNPPFGRNPVHPRLLMQPELIDSFYSQKHEITPRSRSFSPLTKTSGSISTTKLHVQTWQWFLGNESYEKMKNMCSLDKPFVHNRIFRFFHRIISITCL